MKIQHKALTKYLTMRHQGESPGKLQNSRELGPEEKRGFAQDVASSYETYKLLDDSKCDENPDKDVFSDRRTDVEREVYLDNKIDPTTGVPAKPGTRNSIRYGVTEEGRQTLVAESISKDEVRQIAVGETENGVVMFETTASLTGLGIENPSDYSNNHAWENGQAWIIR